METNDSSLVLIQNNINLQLNNFNKLTIKQLKTLINNKKEKLNKINKNNENKIKEIEKLNSNIKFLQNIYNKKIKNNKNKNNVELFNHLNLNSENKIIPPSLTININKKFSIIKVFIYQIVVNKSIKAEYSFNKFNISENKVNNPIKSIQYKKSQTENVGCFSFFCKNPKIKNNLAIKNAEKFLFTKNIIENINGNGNNISKVFKNHELLLLYEEYYTYNARKNISNFKNKKNSNLYKRLKDNIYNKFDELLDKSKDIMLKYIKKFYNSTNIKNSIKNNDDIIIKLEESNDSKIILMGDQHGSFHSFFRLIIRLISTGIMDENYKLVDNYKIIFLGDILDRGNYGLEIMYIILKLMIENNSENKLNVIINRGNHEEENTFKHYGFYLEIFKKINDYNKTLNKFLDFFKYCPCAIILDHSNIKYWLCHGGFYKNIDNMPNFNDNNSIYIIKVNNTSEIRWNDFTNNENNSNSIRGKNIYNIGIKTLYNFLNKYNINFIIRGHSDSESNTMLLTNKNKINKKQLNNSMWYHINDKDHIKLLSKNSDLISYSSKNKKTENEIAIINPINFSNEKELYPILTISNNCDIGRNLYNDSYIIIE